MKIDAIIWKEKFVQKIEKKHHVTIDEVEEILYGKKKVYRNVKGNVDGEDIYLALGKTSVGRFLSIFFILKRDGYSALPISARDMDNKERRRYERG